MRTATRRCGWAAAVAAGMLLGGCGGCRQPGTTPDPTAGQVSARVVLSQAGTTLTHPVEGALVRVKRTTVTTRTAADGTFSIPVPVGHGALSIVHTQDGIQYSASVDATSRGWSPGSNVGLGDIALSLNGAVRGTAGVEDGDQHGQIQVVVVGEPFSTFTGETGAYALDQLAAGNTAFAAVKIGYRLAQFSGVVAPGQVIELRPQVLTRLTGTERTGTLVVRALLLGATDHSGIQLEATGLNGAQVSAVTPGDGRLSVPDITSALINVSFSRTGFTTLRIPYLIIPEGGTLDMGDVVLGHGDEIPLPMPTGTSSSSGGVSSSSVAGSSSAGSSSAASSLSGSSSSGVLPSSASGASSDGSSAPGTSAATSTATSVPASSGAAGSSSSSLVSSSSSVGASSSSGPPAHCFNTVPDPQETGTDCGGPCPACPEGDPCLLPGDCQSGVCSGAFTCATPDCNDNVQNGLETDEDCGGLICSRCSQGQRCVVDNDCLDTRCLGGLCKVTRVLTVNMPDAGQPTGAVESTPPGIFCGGTCVAPFEEGQTVTLRTVTVAPQVFSGWAGDCTGDGGCDVVMTADRTVTAGWTGPLAATPEWYGTFAQTQYRGATQVAWLPSGDVVTATAMVSSFNPGLGPLITAGNNDVAVLRTTPLGIVTAQRRMGGVDNEYAEALVALPSDDVVVMGQTGPGTFEFGDVAQPVTCPTGGGVSMARLGPGLGHIWSRCMPRFDIIGAGLDGALLLAWGSFTGTVDFGDGARTAAGKDMVLLRFQQVDGSLVDVHTWGGPQDDVLYDVVRAPDGSFALAASCEGPLTWGTPGVTTRGEDICVARLNPQFGFTWTRTWGGVGADRAAGVMFLDNGDVVASGAFHADVAFEAAPRPPAQAVGGEDLFLMRLNGVTGALVWSKVRGSSGDDYLNRLRRLPGGHILAGGRFAPGPLSLGGEAFTTGSPGNEDGILGAFTVDGSHLWSRTGRCATGDGVESLAVHPDGRILLGAYCQTGLWGVADSQGPTYLLLR